MIFINHLAYFVHWHIQFSIKFCRVG